MIFPQLWYALEVLQTSDTRVPRGQSKELITEHPSCTQLTLSTLSSPKDGLTRE